MTSFKEDEDIFKLIREIVDIDEELRVDNPSPIRAVLSADKRQQLEKRVEALYEKYVTFKIELDRIRIRETPHHKYLTYVLRKDLAYKPLKTEEFKIFWDDHYEEILDFYQDNELIERYVFARNYFKLVPPYVKVGTNIPEGIQNIYYESRWCFVYGQYSATIALSRTVIETVLRDKFNIEGNLDVIIEEAKSRGIITGNTARKINKIRISANRILHKAKPAKEQEAKNALDHVLDFLEEIYLSA
jgi:hypothetical protein